MNSVMTFRFEEENFKNTYVLEDYYNTNPFIDFDQVLISFHDRENPANRISFILDFNKVIKPVPNEPKLGKVQSEIVKRFVKEIPDELITLFKQRVMEAKAYGEKNPLSYLEFEPGRYVNYLELFPKDQETLSFNYEGKPYFAEDSYEMDPRNSNRDLKLQFFPLELDNKNRPPVFSYTYHFKEELRSQEEGQLESEYADMLVAMHQALPNLYDILKRRYKAVKDRGEELMKSGPGIPVMTESPDRVSSERKPKKKKSKKAAQRLN